MQSPPTFMPTLHTAALVFLGSGAGGLLRYVVGGLVQAGWNKAFPLGTLLVNVSGCLMIGFLATLLARGGGASDAQTNVRALLVTGVLGGYTTFSSFSRETWTLAQEGQQFQAAGYVLMSVGLSLSAAWLGAWVAGRL